MVIKPPCIEAARERLHERVGYAEIVDSGRLESASTRRIGAAANVLPAAEAVQQRTSPACAGLALKASA